jgi:hypothetical protein
MLKNSKFLWERFYNITNMDIKNHSKMWKYTRVLLKVGIKSCDRKYFKDQKLPKYFIEIKNKNRDIYRD